MTLARKTAELAQAINVNTNNINETISVSSSGYIGINTTSPLTHLHVNGSGLFSNDLQTSGTLIASSGNFANMVYVNGVAVSVSGHSHIISDVNALENTLNNKLSTNDAIEGGFF